MNNSIKSFFNGENYEREKIYRSIRVAHKKQPPCWIGATANLEKGDEYFWVRVARIQLPDGFNEINESDRQDEINERCDDNLGTQLFMEQKETRAEFLSLINGG